MRGRFGWRTVGFDVCFGIGSLKYDADGQKLLGSVIVITDRTVLDSQIQDITYHE